MQFHVSVHYYYNMLHFIRTVLAFQKLSHTLTRKEQYNVSCVHMYDLVINNNNNNNNNLRISLLTVTRQMKVKWTLQNLQSGTDFWSITFGKLERLEWVESHCSLLQQFVLLWVSPVLRHRHHHHHRLLSPTCCLWVGVRSSVISVSVYRSVCLSSRMSQKPPSNFANLSVSLHVTCGYGSVLLWRQCDTLSSGSGDEVMFPYNRENRPESNTTRMFRPVRQMAAPELNLSPTAFCWLVLNITAG